MAAAANNCCPVAALGEQPERCPMVGGSSGRQKMRSLPHLVSPFRCHKASLELPLHALCLPAAAADALPFLRLSPGNLLRIGPCPGNAPVPMPLPGGLRMGRDLFRPQERGSAGRQPIWILPYLVSPFRRHKASLELPLSRPPDNRTLHSLSAVLGAFAKGSRAQM